MLSKFASVARLSLTHSPNFALIACKQILSSQKHLKKAKFQALAFKFA